MTITLYAKHSIGCGGYKDEKGQIQSGGVMAYGPGVVEVPHDLAASLLHQDMLARAGDRDFRNTEFRTFLIAPKVAPNGARGLARVELNTSAIDLGATSLDSYGLQIRGYVATVGNEQCSGIL